VINDSFFRYSIKSASREDILLQLVRFTQPADVTYSKPFDSSPGHRFIATSRKLFVLKAHRQHWKLWQ